MMANSSSFRSRFVARAPLLGTFLKTPAYHLVEIIASTEFDFVVIDEEHAPFNRETVDAMIMAARASDIASFVRVPSFAPSGILSVLDCGATGVFVPHVRTPAIAREVVSACRYRGGTRGYSPSGRAGGYGSVTLGEHTSRQDDQTTVIAMIEDPDAIEVIDEIVAVDGIDGIFVGRGDLTVALGAANSGDPVVTEAVARILEAANTAGKPAVVMVGGAEEAQTYTPMGVASFIVGSDQALMKRAAIQTRKAFPVS